MAEEYNENEIPVFIINGFLESGKTQFLRFTLDQDYFNTGEKTLLIVCEEGVEEYPKDLLIRTHTILVQVEDEKDMSKESLEAMVEAYKPERIIIEWNGVWPQNDLRLPDDWFLNQQITIVDTSTLDPYLKNMKPLMGQMLKYTEMVICNRADGISEDILGNYYMQLKAMASAAEIIFEGKDGEIRGDFNINLPYDINADHIDVEPDDFGIFYVDIMDRPERYDGKEVTYTGMVLSPDELGDESFVVGRTVMTCCEADMQFLGPICMYKGASAYKNGDWLKITAKIKAENNEMYAGMGPVLYVSDVSRTGKIEKVAGF